MKNAQNCLFCIFLAAGACLSWAGGQTKVWNHDPLPFNAREITGARLDKSKMWRTGKVAQTLGVSQGMSILNVRKETFDGFALKFAQTLKGTGRVDDISSDEAAVNALKSKAQRKRLANLFPLLVTPAGEEGFLSQKRYDLIFLGNGTQYIKDIRVFAKQMRGHLTGKGRLGVLLYESPDRFTEGSFTDVPGLLKEVLKEPPESPFYKYLNWIKKDLPKADPKIEDTAKLKKDLVIVFNQIMFDPALYTSFLQPNTVAFQPLPLKPPERKYMDFKMGVYKKYRILNAAGRLSEKYLKQYQMPSGIPVINQTLIIQRFRKYLFGGKSPYLPPGHKTSSGSKALIEDFKASGYKLEAKYGFIPYVDLVVFSLAQ